MFALSLPNTHLPLGQVGTWVAGAIKPRDGLLRSPQIQREAPFTSTTLGIAGAEHVALVPPASSTRREKHARRNVFFDAVFTTLSPTPACPRGEKLKQAAWVRLLPSLGHPQPD